MQDVQDSVIGSTAVTEQSTAEMTQFLVRHNYTTPETHLPVWSRTTGGPISQRFLWHFFVVGFLKKFLCFEPQEVGHQSSFEDPFLVLFPQLALTSPCLLAAVLSFSLQQYAAYRGTQTISISPDYYSSQAIQALTKRELGSMQPKMLLSIIATGVFLHLGEQDRKQNCLELARSAAAYLADIASSTPLASSQEYQLIMALLRWADISTLCSLQVRTTPVTKGIHRSIQLRQHEVHENFSRVFSHWVTHPIFGFSAHLVNPLLELGRLLQLQLRCFSSIGNDGGSFDVDEAAQATALEDDILTASGNFHTWCQSKDLNDLQPLVHLNAAMHASTELLFYSRLRGFPFTAPLIRSYVRQILDHVLQVPQNSPAFGALLFPLCVAGCEAVDEDLRAVVVLKVLLLHQGTEQPEMLVRMLKQLTKNTELLYGFEADS
ncbi:fungal-specific transcription factor domain-containing protein [Boeremia exigua]|uniref:fungal-specific transcription factor domain-containing protein n=1 Tax=Boeremia exigua TaxID=749465 RepID=UPI001E8E0DE1|nr:fungal-specific transcription factor domain-containing protein [Boeremia exigua]KAH6612395.1 fungal-specific transcription factor domain-containing protein [Boeremia exigua]